MFTVTNDNHENCRVKNEQIITIRIETIICMKLKTVDMTMTLMIILSGLRECILQYKKMSFKYLVMKMKAMRFC